MLNAHVSASYLGAPLSRKISINPVVCIYRSVAIYHWINYNTFMLRITNLIPSPCIPHPQYKKYLNGHPTLITPNGPTALAVA